LAARPPAHTTRAARSLEHITSIPAGKYRARAREQGALVLPPDPAVAQPLLPQLSAVDTAHPQDVSGTHARTHMHACTESSARARTHARNHGCAHACTRARTTAPPHRTARTRTHEFAHAQTHAHAHAYALTHTLAAEPRARRTPACHCWAVESVSGRGAKHTRAALAACAPPAA
jgi:hypothetical protein